MQPATSIQELLPGVFTWSAYSPQHKVELRSHAVLNQGVLTCFDPIPLSLPARDALLALASTTTLVLTNGNHERDSLDWQKRHQISLWASAESGLDLNDLRVLPAQGAWQGWKVESLEGGGPGEIAFRLEDRRLVVAGDAIINLPGRALELLPDKYCSDPAVLRKSLRLWVADPFDTLLLAHGDWLPELASARVEALLS